MNSFDYIVANDFDRAWLNFELDLPLKPGKNGEPNPFYVNRPANPIAELTDAGADADLTATRRLALAAHPLEHIEADGGGKAGGAGADNHHVEFHRLAGG